MQNDDDTWLDALAGKRGEGNASATTEGRTLRDGLLAHGAALESNSASQDSIPEQDAAREAELIARARAAGLLPGAPLAPATRTRSWYSSLPVRLAAAAIFGVAIGLPLYSHFGEPRETLRAPTEGIVRIRAADPEQLKGELIRELRAAGVKATGYESLGVQGVDADVPSPLPPEVKRILEKHGIPEPHGMVLQVQIDPKPAQ